MTDSPTLSRFVEVFSKINKFENLKKNPQGSFSHKTFIWSYNFGEIGGRGAAPRYLIHFVGFRGVL